ncbi:MAG TPA: glycosyltransferase family 39 protein [Candidatus Acidoferrum sp.]|nr:glycosyltransferase family 39 protein [Candidatus Acidoferrum sp.]
MDQSQKKIDVRLQWILAAALLACAIVSLGYAVKTARMPMQFDYEEGNILNAGLRITHGETPYPAPGGWPVVINPYGPIPYLLTAALIKLFGTGFFAPRVVSIVCAALIALLIGVLIRRCGGSWAISIVFACVFLSLDSIRNWMLTSRVDWLALTLSFGGLAVSVLWGKRWYLAAVLFAAALLVKYTLVAAPLACGLYLISRRDWKRLLQLAGTAAAICAAGFLVTQWWSGGHFMFYAFATHPDRYSWAQCFRFMTRRLGDIPLVFGIAGIGCVSELWRKQFTMPALYFLTATAGALTVGKSGSSSNHLIEWTAAACWCAGYAWKYVQEWLAARRLAIASRVLLCGVAATAVIAVALYRLPFAERTVCGPAYAYLKGHGDHVLTDSVGALLMSGKPVLISNPFVYTQLVEHSGWPDRQIRDRVKAREFDVILLREQIAVYPPGERFTAEALQAMRENYHLAAEFECYDSGFAYLPNP